MTAADIEDRDSFDRWALNKPREWLLTVASRAALRTLPIALDSRRYRAGISRQRLASSIFRLVAISWGAVKCPIYETATAIRAIEDARLLDSTDSTRADTISALRSINSAAATAADGGYSVTSSVLSSVAAAGAISGDAKAGQAIWAEIRADSFDLENTFDHIQVLSKPLWRTKPPQWFSDQWIESKDELNKLGSYTLWIDWYNRRLDGQKFTFPVKDEYAEAEINRRLFSQSHSWWLRPPQMINTDIASWISELSDIQSDPTDAQLEQSPLALNFILSAEWFLDLSPAITPDSFEDNEDSKDRHAETLIEAEAALRVSAHGLTQATDLAPPISSYIDALGTNVSEIRPSLLVLRGNKLRRILEQRQDEMSLAAPLSQDQTDTLSSWLDAHNLLVSLDPYLSRIEQGLANPENSTATIKRFEAKVLIQTLQTEHITSLDAANALDDAVDNIPVNADSNDRRWHFATESLSNLIRAAGKIIKTAKNLATKLLKAGQTAWGGIKTAQSIITWSQENMTLLNTVFDRIPWVIRILQWISNIKI